MEESEREAGVYICASMKSLRIKGSPVTTNARVQFGNRSQSRDSSSIVPPDWISPFFPAPAPTPSSRFPCLLAVARLCGGCCLLFHPQRFRVLGKRTGGSPLSAVFSRPRSDAHTIRHRMSAICSKNVPNRSEYYSCRPYGHTVISVISRLTPPLREYEDRRFPPHLLPAFVLRSATQYGKP